MTNEVKLSYEEIKEAIVDYILKTTRKARKTSDVWINLRDAYPVQGLGWNTMTPATYCATVLMDSKNEKPEP